MASRISITIDVEKDPHSETYRSLWEGISTLKIILDRFDIKATFFTPAKLLDKFPDFFMKLKKQGHEIAIHGYEHERFDILPSQEKAKRIWESVMIYNKTFRENPKGFRAPQHSIDKETLEILYENNFLYDASYTPFNLLQIMFFPKRLNSWKGFFKPLKIHKIINNFYEIPTTAFIIPFVSLPLRVFSWTSLKLYLNSLKLINKDLVFYAHSWDFIDLPESRIDRTFPHTKLLKNLDKMINHLYPKNKFLKMEELVNEKKE